MYTVPFTDGTDVALWYRCTTVLFTDGPDVALWHQCTTAVLVCLADALCDASVPQWYLRVVLM